VVSSSTLTNGVPKGPKGERRGFCHFWHLVILRSPAPALVCHMVLRLNCTANRCRCMRPGFGVCFSCLVKRQE
jgi:hypothetical protein